MMSASWRAVRPLLLPFFIVQLQYIQLQILLLATRRRRAMNIRRHCHCTSEWVGMDRVSTQRRGRPRKKELPPQAHADAALSAGSSPVARPPAATACKHWQFRDYVFDQGRIHLAQRRLDRVTAKELGDPPGYDSTKWTQWKNMERTGEDEHNITRSLELLAELYLL
jgi:hypothetical protein